MLTDHGTTANRDFVCHDCQPFDEFMAWLSENRHEEIKMLLEVNTTATIGIKALLGQGLKEIRDELQSLDESLAAFAASHEVRGWVPCDREDEGQRLHGVPEEVIRQAAEADGRGLQPRGWQCSTRIAVDCARPQLSGHPLGPETRCAIQLASPEQSRALEGER